MDHFICIFISQETAPGHNDLGLFLCYGPHKQTAKATPLMDAASAVNKTTLKLVVEGYRSNPHRTGPRRDDCPILARGPVGLSALFTHTLYHVKHWTFNHPLENFLKTFQGSVIQFPHALPRDAHLHGDNLPLLIVYESSCQYLLLFNTL